MGPLMRQLESCIASLPFCQLHALPAPRCVCRMLFLWHTPPGTAFVFKPLLCLLLAASQLWQGVQSANLWPV